MCFHYRTTCTRILLCVGKKIDMVKMDKDDVFGTKRKAIASKNREEDEELRLKLETVMVETDTFYIMKRPPTGVIIAK